MSNQEIAREIADLVASHGRTAEYVEAYNNPLNRNFAIDRLEYVEWLEGRVKEILDESNSTTT